MENSHDYRQLVFKMAEASQPEKKSGIQFRETLESTILRILSTSRGIVVLTMGVSGILGSRAAELGIAAIIGEMQGAAGVTIGRARNGTISPLAALGTALNLILIMYLFFGQFVLIHFQG
jgi:hypothetical protein